MSKDKTFDFSVKLSQFTLNIFGLWPLGKNRFANLKFFIMLLSINTMFVSSSAFMFYAESYGQFFDCLINSLVMLVTIVKLVIVNFKYKSVKIIFKAMKNDWRKYKRFTTKNKELVNHHASKGRLSSGICIFFMQFSTIIYLFSKIMITLLQPANVRVWKLPHEAVYPFEVGSDSALFVPVYLWQLYTIMVVGGASITVDCLLITTASHATGQLAVLCENIRVFSDSKRHGQSTRLECSCIKCIIERHVDIARYCKLVEDSYNLILLAEFIGTTIQFCLQMYFIVVHTSHKNIIGVLSFCIYLLVFNFRLCMYCNVFDGMVEMGENVQFSAYEIDWYDFNPEAIRSLMFCIIRASKPLNVTAGKFFNLNRNSYKNVIFTSSSYASVLLSIK